MANYQEYQEFFDNNQDIARLLEKEGIKPNEIVETLRDRRALHEDGKGFLERTEQLLMISLEVPIAGMICAISHVIHDQEKQDTMRRNFNQKVLRAFMPNKWHAELNLKQDADWHRENQAWHEAKLRKIENDDTLDGEAKEQKTAQAQAQRRSMRERINLTTDLLK